MYILCLIVVIFSALHIYCVQYKNFSKVKLYVEIHHSCGMLTGFVQDKLIRFPKIYVTASA